MTTDRIEANRIKEEIRIFMHPNKTDFRMSKGSAYTEPLTHLQNLESCSVPKGKLVIVLITSLETE